MIDIHIIWAPNGLICFLCHPPPGGIHPQPNAKKTFTGARKCFIGAPVKVLLAPRGKGVIIQYNII